MWFLEESNETEKVVPTSELMLAGESLNLNIDSIFIVLEAGIGHRTVPMLLAKSRLWGECENWSTLINLHFQLELEVSVYIIFQVYDASHRLFWDVITLFKLSLL